MSDLPPTYVEDPNLEWGGTFFDENTYSKILDTLPIVCADTVIVNGERETFYLARRRAKPMAGWWEIGGRMRAGEPEAVAAQRCFARETGLNVRVERFIYIRTIRTIWASRQQHPQDHGSDNLIFQFYVDLLTHELDAVRLDRNEYEDGGLTEFTRSDLREEGVHAGVGALYDRIFSSGYQNEVFLTHG